MDTKVPARLRVPRLIASAALMIVVYFVTSSLLPARADRSSLDCPTFPHTVPASDVADLINTINCANSTAGDNVINLTESIYTLTLPNNSVDGGNGLPTIKSYTTAGRLTINGNGATIERSHAVGTPDFRILEIESNGRLTLNQVMLTNGKASDSGGAIANRGSLTLNTSTIYGNTALNDGGAIWTPGGVSLRNSTISGNTVTAPLTSRAGGIFSDHGDIYLLFSTVAFNTGAAADNLYGTGITSFRNSLVVGDEGHTNETYNHYAVTNTIVGSNDNLLLGLADNGGTTLTHMLASESRARDFVPGGSCTDFAGVAVTADQRGMPRPMGNSCDAGAVETVCPSMPDVIGTTDDLKVAIDIANCNPADNVIDLEPGATYTLIDRDNTALGGTGLPEIKQTVTINGNGAIIERSGAEGTPDFRIFTVATGATLNLNDLIVRGGRGQVGGGMLIDTGGHVTITNSAFDGNDATGDRSPVPTTSALGGAIYNRGTLAITGSSLTNNTSDGGAYAGSAAGIYNYNHASLQVTNSTFSNNRATGSGGAIVNAVTAMAVITNATFAENTADSGDGIYNSGTVTINNSIFADASSTGDCYSYGTATVNYSLIADHSCGVSGGVNGNLTGDPELGDLTGSPAYYPLAFDSVALNAGSNALIPAGVTTDITGSPRIFSGIVDMGAYEINESQCPEFPYAVPAGRSGLLSYAITCANLNDTDDEIDLANAYYDLSQINNLSNGANGLPIIEASEFVGTLTINGNHAVIQRSYLPDVQGFRIFYIDAGAELTLNDTNMVNGTATNGGAIYNNYGTVTLNHSVVSANTATSYGGGLYNRGSLTLADSVVTGNSAQLYGGGILNYGSLAMTNSSVTLNSGKYGGGIDNEDGTVALNHVSFFANSASVNGGAFYGTSEYSDAALEVKDSDFIDNTAVNDGGAMYFLRFQDAPVHTITITGGSFTHNSAGGGGGAMVMSNLDTTITGTVIVDNSARWGGGILNYATLVLARELDCGKPCGAGRWHLYNLTNPPSMSPPAPSAVTWASAIRLSNAAIPTIHRRANTARTPVRAAESTFPRGAQQSSATALLMATRRGLAEASTTAAICRLIAAPSAAIWLTVALELPRLLPARR